MIEIFNTLLHMKQEAILKFEVFWNVAKLTDFLC
jgi:hypothetical protein